MQNTLGEESSKKVISFTVCGTVIGRGFSLTHTLSHTHTLTHSQGNGLEDIGCHPSSLSLPVFPVKVSRGMTNAYSTVKQAK